VPQTRETFARWIPLFLAKDSELSKKKAQRYRWEKFLFQL